VGKQVSVIPGLAVLRGYRRDWLAGDLLAGVTVAAYLVPQVMAYATIAGLPPVTGLWAAFPALIAYALFGSSRSLSMGFSDDVVTARSFARRGEEISANRELLALGVANAGSALVRGFPAAWPPRSGRSCCSRPCLRRCRPTGSGPKTLPQATNAHDRPYPR
jgi:MFS superfamily sulfate permease-like transporter